MHHRICACWRFISGHAEETSWSNEIKSCLLTQKRKTEKVFVFSSWYNTPKIWSYSTNWCSEAGGSKCHQSSRRWKRFPERGICGKHGSWHSVKKDLEGLSWRVRWSSGLHSNWSSYKLSFNFILREICCLRKNCTHCFYKNSRSCTDLRTKSGMLAYGSWETANLHGRNRQRIETLNDFTSHQWLTVCAERNCSNNFHVWKLS